MKAMRRYRRYKRKGDTLPEKKKEMIKIRRRNLCIGFVICGIFLVLSFILFQPLSFLQGKDITESAETQSRSSMTAISRNSKSSSKIESEENSFGSGSLLKNVFPDIESLDLPSSIAEESSLTTEKEPVYVKETQKEILDFYEENAKDRETVSSQGTAEIPTPPPSKEQSQTEKRVWLSDVPFISQVGRYPTGCESVSAVMACQYAGLSIDVDTFIRSYLPRGSFTYENGKMIGWHPNTCFMGDPFTQYGFGCYAPCIEKAILKFLPAGYTLRNTTGTSLTSLCHEYIDKGIPVVVWATMYMNPPTQGRQWILQENGSLFQWIGREHCLVLTGYDSWYYYFNDPLSGRVKYAKSLVETRFAQLGKQSLVIYASDSGETSSQESSQEPESSLPPEESSSEASSVSSEESSTTSSEESGESSVDTSTEENESSNPEQSTVLNEEKDI